MFKKRSSKKTKTRDESEDTSWIVEGIIAYLRSPTWRVPVFDFVDSQCGKFTNSEENSFEHSDIHQKYKTLVEKLLGNYTKELGISENQFSAACSRTNRDIANMDSNFEFIWAADDFLIFKSLMVKHNVELEREALKMVEAGYTHDGASISKTFLTDEDAATVTKMLKSSKMSLSERKLLQQQEENDLKLALEFSRMEMERLNTIAEREDMLLKQAIELSLAGSQSSPTEYKDDPTLLSHAKDSKKREELNNELTKPVSVSHTLPSDFSENSLGHAATYQPPPVGSPSQPVIPKDSTNKSKNKNEVEGKIVSPSRTFQGQKTNSSSSTPNTVGSLPPLKSKKDISSAEAANAWLDQAMRGITEPTKNSNPASSSGDKYRSIDQEELAKRKEYLQQQRDKLLAMKKKERNKQLEDFIEKKKDEAETKPEIQTDPEEAKKLASRRAVAARLKQEVINKK